ncbi:MAG: TIGR02646 family protein [Deltaproteobacteria bacterium]|jgi:uncharacterized protein (TIGR02646 family)|nr:TIGR02646 family protein [Deltaproteobacteria bacterium]
MHRIKTPSLLPGFTETVEEIKKKTEDIELDKKWKLRWKKFKKTKFCKKLVEHLKNNQNSLCAYCEKKITKDNQEIEHFIPKSMSTENYDYTFEFSNLLLCCRDSQKTGNLSCGQKKKGKDPKETCLNPYTMPDIRLFEGKLVDTGIQLIPDETACSKAKTDVTLVWSTIKMLKLNTPFLCSQRRVVWKRFEKYIKEARLMEGAKQTEEKQKLKSQYQQVQEYITTIRWTLDNFLNES